MSVGFYKQDEENAADLLVCPDCGGEILISEYGEVGLCSKCYEEFPLSECSTKFTETFEHKEADSDE